MKHIATKSVLSALLGLSIAFNLTAADESPFKSPGEKASYALGLNIGKQLKQNGAEIDTEIYMKALKDGIAGKGLMTDEQVRETLMAFQTELRNKTLDKNKKEGATFLEENKKKEGIVTLPSGSDANRHAVYEAADKAMYEAKRGGKDGARASGWADL